MTVSAPGPTLERMECMEVWGGNCGVDRAFRMPGLEVWIYSKPHGDSDAGGDVYYLSSCASGRITRMLLADVSGHGAEVSGLATALRDLMRRHVNHVNQSRFVERMNREFARLPSEGSFATALVATFFQPTRRLTVSNAGHPYPLLYDATQQSWSMIVEPEHSESELANMPFGLHDRTRYVQSQRVLSPGDMVLFYSDAVNESVDTAGNLLGVEGVLKTMSELGDTPPEELLHALRSKIAREGSDSRHDDDLTMLLCRATATGTTLRNNLLAPLRLLRPVTDNTVLRQTAPE
jgi:serine phosphatase RsbU (regulator of sigma subunit)